MFKRKKNKKGFTRALTLPLRSLVSHFAAWKNGLTPAVNTNESVKLSPTSTAELVRGFILLESIVAVGIAGVTLAAFLTTATASFRLLDNAERNYTAVKIAQEGMELLIAKRNNNVLCLRHKSACPIDSGSPDDWQDGFAWGPDRYEIDAHQTEKLSPYSGNVSVRKLPVWGSGRLLCLADDGRFGYTSGSGYTCPDGVVRGDFKRRIETESISISGVPQSHMIKTKVIVEWKDRAGVGKTLVLDKILFDTYP